LQQDWLVVNTPESVELKLELAGLGSRFLAVAIDTLLQALLLVLVLGAGALAGWFQQGIEAQITRTADTTWGAAFLFLLLWLLFYCYYTVFEMVWQGQTPGKRLLGLRVLDRSGRPAGPGALVIRNLVRLIDSLPVPVAYPAGVISFLTTRLGQRLGDLAAGTVVVRERRLRLAQPGTVPGGRFRQPGVLPPDPNIVAAYAGRLRQEELDLLQAFLARRKGLGWGARRVLAQRLALMLARKMQYPYDLSYAEPFLETVHRVARRPG
jgi:uncharacterized RDD family membrane protein YckC